MSLNTTTSARVQRDLGRRTETTGGVLWRHEDKVERAFGTTGVDGRTLGPLWAGSTKTTKDSGRPDGTGVLYREEDPEVPGVGLSPGGRTVEGGVLMGVGGEDGDTPTTGGTTGGVTDDGGTTPWSLGGVRKSPSTTPGEGVGPRDSGGLTVVPGEGRPWTLGTYLVPQRPVSDPQGSRPRSTHDPQGPRRNQTPEHHRD